MDRPPAEHQVDTQPDRPLTGDALFRFASRRIEPSECQHVVWQQSMMEGEVNASRQFPEGSLNAAFQEQVSLTRRRLPLTAWLM
ncbi:hypothetical protein [Rhodopila sp.]|uniref:hypothetical protein n=1 Tax=Rhodopila sp. TaxID=2480087 RepID=UPI003D1233F6